MTKTQCAECKKFFTGTSEFDAHRTGEYGKRGAEGRRCKTDDEMAADGFNAIAMTITDLEGKPRVPVWGRGITGESRRGRVRKAVASPTS